MSKKRSDEVLTLEGPRGTFLKSLLLDLIFQISLGSSLLTISGGSSQRSEGSASQTGSCSQCACETTAGDSKTSSAYLFDDGDTHVALQLRRAALPMKSRELNLLLFSGLSHQLQAALDEKLGLDPPLLQAAVLLV